MNKFILSGTVCGNPKFSHETVGEKFYCFDLKSKRKSENTDIIPCVVSEMFLSKIKENEKVLLKGNVRTRNVYDEDSRHLEITMFVLEVGEYGDYDINEVELEGTICKEPICRDTPLGRQIADVLIASNRERSNKSDYIPCLLWGRNALRVSKDSVGDKVKVWGRLQSRVYSKKLEDDVTIEKVAYELSVSKYFKDYNN